MTLRTFLVTSAIGSALGWLVWGSIVAWLDPVQAAGAGFLLFFLALFLAVSSSAALLGYAVRRLLAPNSHPAYSVRPSLRQGIWLGVFLDALLTFQLVRLNRWWITLILIIFFLSIEFVFLSYDRNAKRSRAAENQGVESA